MEKRKILIIDDDKNTREIYAEIFKNSGFEVLEASDGVEGLDLATKNIPDAIFTGIIMPRMDGFSLMEALKKNVSTAKIPVVVSSHMGREEDQKKAIELGAKDFIVRDLTPPNQAAERIKAVFSGNEYFLDFDRYGRTAPKLAEALGLNGNFQCKKCGGKMALRLCEKENQNGSFDAKMICSDCGWIAA